MSQNQNQNDYTAETTALQNAKSFVLILLIAVLSFYAMINNTKNQGQILPMMFGKGCAVVMSGSMEPTIPVDALIFVDEQDSYDVDEIVVIQDNYSLVVHRIVSMENGQVITKGDANNTVDKPVPVSSIRGRVVWHIPHVGSAVRLMKTPFGSLMLIFVVLLLWMSMNKSSEENDDDNLDETSITENNEETLNTESGKEILNTESIKGNSGDNPSPNQ